MLDLLRSVKKKLNNLRTDAIILKKDKNEVRDQLGEQKDKYLSVSKRYIENNEEVCTHCFKCCGKVILPESAVKLRKWEKIEQLRQSSVISPGEPQYCIYCQNKCKYVKNLWKL